MQKIRWSTLLLLVTFGVSACGASGPGETVSLIQESSANAEQTTANPPTLEPAPTAEPEPTLPPLPIIGPAPDFQNDVWLNSEPLRLADLEGKVVLLEFWTFG